MGCHTNHNYSRHHQGSAEWGSPSKEGHSNSSLLWDHTDHVQNTAANTLKYPNTMVNSERLYCQPFYYIIYQSQFLSEIKWEKSHSLTVSTLKTLKSKKSVFSCNSWFLSRRASLGPGIVPSGPCTENLNTVLNTTNTCRLQLI